MIFLECVNDQVSPCCHYCDWRGPAELLAMICTVEEWFPSPSSPDDCGGSIIVLFGVVVNGDVSVRHPCTQPSPTSPALISQNAAFSGSVICPSLAPPLFPFCLASSFLPPPSRWLSFVAHCLARIWFWRDEAAVNGLQLDSTTLIKLSPNTASNEGLWGGRVGGGGGYKRS